MDKVLIYLPMEIFILVNIRMASQKVKASILGKMLPSTLVSLKMVLSMARVVGKVAKALSVINTKVITVWIKNKVMAFSPGPVAISTRVSIKKMSVMVMAR